jgi:probable HAF family extracellular repeat protein
MEDMLMTNYRSIYRTILLSALVTCIGIRETGAAAPAAYHITDLGTLGGNYSAGLSISASGQITGNSSTAADIALHAFVYNGTMHDLETLGGGYSVGLGINDTGRVAGESTTVEGKFHAFLYDGTMNDLGTLGGAQSRGNGINDNGNVAGQSDTTEGESHAFLYDGTLHDLGTLGGTFSGGQGINASGQVTGLSSTIAGAPEHAFLWIPTMPNGDSGTMNDLGTLGGSYSVGFGINDSGQVAGQSLTIEGAAHAFVYDGTMHDLGTLGGDYSAGSGINASGQVVGQSSLSAGGSHAFLYTSGSGIVDLNSLIDPLSGWELAVAEAINDAGQITGFGSIGGESHAYLLTPVPEPASLALALLGVPLIVRRSSRRSRDRTN